MPSDPTQLADELAREREEVRRLREFLVVRDGELGAVRGRLLELETRARFVFGGYRRLREFPKHARNFLAGRRG